MRLPRTNYAFLVAAVGVLLPENLARSQSSAECPAPRIESLEQLAGMSWCELEALYRHSCPTEIPVGYARGIPLYDPAKRFTGLRTKCTRALWRGKHVRCDDSLINQWCGLRAIKAEVYCGESWLDGRPAVIMDYSKSSWVWRDVRDEVREVAPGLFLGVMYLRRCPQPRLKMFFALDARSHCCQVPHAQHP
jgi:hypothetical protein